jgi:hypothetical protein
VYRRDRRLKRIASDCKGNIQPDCAQHLRT